VEPLEREHTRACVRPVDARHRDVRMAGEVAVEAVGVTAFVAVVELLPDRPGELVDDLVRVDEVERANSLLREARRLVHQREVGFNLPRRVGTLHLDEDAPAVREHGAVHLADRRSGERLLLELEEEALERQPELGLDRPTRLLERERPDVVLQRAELGDDVGRDDVGPRREQLPELDERRPELVEHFAQMAAPRGRAVRIDAVAAALHDVPEAVADRDLRDLAHPADVALLRTGSHALSVAAPPALEANECAARSPARSRAAPRPGPCRRPAGRAGPYPAATWATPCPRRRRR